MYIPHILHCSFSFTHLCLYLFIYIVFAAISVMSTLGKVPSRIGMLYKQPHIVQAFLGLYTSQQFRNCYYQGWMHEVPQASPCSPLALLNLGCPTGCSTFDHFCLVLTIAYQEYLTRPAVLEIQFDLCQSDPITNAFFLPNCLLAA